MAGLKRQSRKVSQSSKKDLPPPSWLPLPSKRENTTKIKLYYISFHFLSLSLSLSLFLSFFHFSFSFFLKGWGGPSDGRGESQCFRVLMPLWRQGSAPCWLPDGDPVVTSGQTHLLSPTHQHRPYLVAFLRYPRRSARNQQTITASKLICVGHRQSLAEIFTNSPE